MKPTDFRFHHPLRVRWAEVDLQKIVFNPHYLTYYDCAMADYWRALALPYEAALQRLQGDIFLRKTTVEFHASALLDDRLDVALRCDRVGNSSITFAGAIFRGEQLLNTAELVYVFADPASQSSRPVPAPLRALFAAYEAGQPVTEATREDFLAWQKAFRRHYRRCLGRWPERTPLRLETVERARAMHATLPLIVQFLITALHISNPPPYSAELRLIVQFSMTP